MVTVVPPYSQFFFFFFLWCRVSSLFFCIEYTVIPPPFVTNFTKITFHNGTISTSLFNKNWPYSVKQDKQVLHSFAFWGSSTPPPANTHTHTRLKILTAKFQKQTIHFWHHSELHDQLSHSVLPWMQIISLSSVSHALVTHQLLRYQLDQSTVVVSQCLCSSSLYFT